MLKLGINTKIAKIYRSPNQLKEVEKNQKSNNSQKAADIKKIKRMLTTEIHEKIV
jgi:hypothetical protein